MSKSSGCINKHAVKLITKCNVQSAGTKNGYAGKRQAKSRQTQKCPKTAFFGFPESAETGKCPVSPPAHQPSWLMRI